MNVTNPPKEQHSEPSVQTMDESCGLHAVDKDLWTIRNLAAGVGGVGAVHSVDATLRKKCKKLEEVA